jgi:hypothetical protein
MNKLMLYAVVIALAACKNKKATSTEQDNKQGDTARFFQVNQFINQQLSDIAKTPYYVYKIQQHNGVRDSTTLANDKVKDYASEFLQPDINNEEIKQYYKENVFHDQSTGSFTISYTTTNKDLEIQNLDVLLQEDGKTVKWIFVRKFTQNRDTSVIKQLSWKQGLNFEVNRLSSVPGQPDVQDKTIVVWNEKR